MANSKDRKMVEIMIGIGMTQKQAAEVIGISQPTMVKYYYDQIQVGGAKVEAMLSSALLRFAQGNDGSALKAIMFTLQCRFGWSPYVPRSALSPTAELGKKEAANLEAQTAHEHSDWGQLLN